MRQQTYHQRVVAGTTATLTWQQIDGLGEPADPGTVTVTVTRSDGTAIATAAATSGTATATRTYDLTPTQTATLDTLTATWAASGVTLATTSIDVVSAPWFGNAELRETHPTLNGLVAYPAARLAAARSHVEMMFERITHRRFVPGYSLVTIPGVFSRDLIVPYVDLRRVRSAALYEDPAASPFETLDAGELAAIPASPSGIATRYLNLWAARWVKIGVEHGLDAPPPELKAAAMRLVREVLEKPRATTPDQAATWNSTDFGWSAVFVTPGVRGAHTSIPAVNEALDAWTFDQIGIA